MWLVVVNLYSSVSFIIYIYKNLETVIGKNFLNFFRPLYKAQAVSAEIFVYTNVIGLCNFVYPVEIKVVYRETFGSPVLVYNGKGWVPLLLSRSK